MHYNFHKALSLGANKKENTRFARWHENASVVFH